MATPSRRERARSATTTEIRRTARELLVREGPDELTLRAIAREMGLSPPALYRYFDSHEAIVEAMCEDVLAEITTTLEQARDAVGAGDPVGRLMAACRAFRRWSLAHPREFQVTFASPAASLHGGDDVADLSFGAVFLGIFAEIWAHRPFLVHPPEALPPALRSQLEAFSARTGDQVPLGVLVAFLGGWVRLYGAVTVEVFGHLGFALDDPEPMFEAMLTDMARALTTDP